MAEENEHRVLVLVRDLLFSSRITATAAAQGVACKVIREPAKLASEAGARLIVDLNQTGTIEAATQWREKTGGTVIGFVAHTDGAIIAQAKAAGIARIMVRSQFVASLESLLVD
jgi:hypothetical protein